MNTRTRTRDRVLNAAIVRADISESFESPSSLLSSFATSPNQDRR